MQLTTLRHFRAIAQHGHLTRAARALGVTQPALSAMLAKLEKEVGAQLVHRTSKGVELTEAGRVFLGYADQAVRRADEGVLAVRQLLGLERGSIRIGGGATATTYLLPPVVSAVRKAHPGLRFYVREAGSSAVALGVLSGELDLGVVTLPMTVPDTEGLKVTPLVHDELRLILPPGHALASAGPRSRATFTWADLAGQSVVAFEAGTAVRSLVDEAAARAGIALNVVMELRSIESIKRMVGAGIGVGFVSRFALSPGEGLACATSPLSRQLALVRPADRDPSPAARAFESALREAYSKRPPAPARRSP